MPRYTLFAPSGAPVRAKAAPKPLMLAINDWQIKIGASSQSGLEGSKGYVLTQVDHNAPLRTHIIKSAKDAGASTASVRGWDPVAKTKITSQSHSQWMPEVDDQVLVAFEHGQSASHAALFLHPGAMTRGSAQVQVDIAPGTYLLQILKTGAGSLSIAAATAADAQLSRSLNWKVIL